VRRPLALLLLLVLALPALALAGHKDPKEQFTPADRRKATSLVLVRGDFVAGWKKTPSTPDDDKHYDCGGYDPDASDLVLTGKAEADFEHKDGIPSVYSFAGVYKTRAHAAASWTRTVKPALVTCLATLFREGLEAEGLKVALGARGRIAFPKVAPRTAAYRIAMRITVEEGGKATHVPVTMHLIALGHGRGEAGLMTIAPGAGLAPGDLRAFARLTAKRMAAAKL
jgi:hypothetical protein